jgi:hypothetical protein
VGADVGRRIARGLLAWTLAVVVVRAVILQPEQCDVPSTDELRHAASEAVAWAVRTQRDDGRWIYRYDVADDRDLGIYEVVRHSGLMMSLYQAQRDGFAEAGDAADRGMAYVESTIVDAGGGLAVGGGGARISTGASALLLAGLTERREATGDIAHDELMAGIARFIVSQVEPNGAVAAYFDTRADRPVPRTYSPFFTGESFFALARMHLEFPDDGWDEPARRIARYLATERDDAEDRFPDIPDHWASYGFAEMTRWPGEEGGAALDTEMRSYARHVAELESMQVRWDSTRTNSRWSRLTRGAQAVGAGVGTIGEALTMLWRTPGLGTAELHERASCAVSVIVDRQVSEQEAARYPNADFARGTWVTGTETQIDDQQHSLSAILNLLNNIEAGATT